MCAKLQVDSLKTKRLLHVPYIQIDGATHAHHLLYINSHTCIDVLYLCGKLLYLKA